MDVSCEMLLHPELMSNEQLLYIIEQRKLKVARVECMSRDELLELFHQYCVPHGQRRYRDSGRGKLFNKLRDNITETAPKLTTINDRNFKSTNFSNERVKPPPDLLSGHIKRIRLDSVTPPVNNAQSNCLKRTISVTPATDSPPPKKERKAITWP